jgi:hypothetical protein
LFSGDTTTGPLASHVLVHQSTGTTNNAEGLIGGGVSGIDQAFSLIGDSTSDVIQVPQAGPSFAIVDGRTIVGPPPLASPFDTLTTGSVTVPFPAGWGATAEGGGRLLPDINGDGRPDFAISNASGSVTGKVAVFW